MINIRYSNIKKTAVEITSPNGFDEKVLEEIQRILEASNKKMLLKLPDRSGRILTWHEQQVNDCWVCKHHKPILIMWDYENDFWGCPYDKCKTPK